MTHNWARRDYAKASSGVCSDYFCKVVEHSWLSLYRNDDKDAGRNNRRKKGNTGNLVAGINRNMTSVKETGGARIGVANATWPFATLNVTKDKLELNAGIIGNLVFRPKDVISLVPESGFLSKGLRIVHRVPSYKDKVIFWTSGNPAELLKRIEQTGFLTNNSSLESDEETEILDSQTRGGTPIKVSAMIVFALVWNICLILDLIRFLRGDKQSSPLDTGALVALSFAFITGIAILSVDPFRRLVLKEGRTVKDVRGFVYFMMLICGLMILSITLDN